MKKTVPQHHTIGNILNKEYNSSLTRVRGPSNTDKFSELVDFLDLVKKWSKVVGEKLAEHTAPLKISNKSLIVLTDHPAYSQQLSFLEKDILKKIFQNLPALEKIINRISFQLNNSHFIKRKFEIDQIIQSIPKEINIVFHPLDPKVIQLKNEAALLFNDITDEEIKENLTSIYLQVSYTKN